LEDNSHGTYTQRDRFRKPLYVCMAAVFVVLLIACANVANLFLARGAVRQREISVRLAIGAGRASIVWQLLTESLLIAMCGAVIGIVLAYGLDSALLTILRQGTASLALDIHPDAQVLTFTSVISLLTGLLFGVFPAFQSARADVNPSLNEETRIAGGRRRGLVRRALVVAQVALSLVLLASAGLFARTLANLRTFDSGYDRGNLLLASFNVRRNGYSSDAMYRIQDEMLARVRALPGVKSAAAASTPVLSAGSYLFPLAIPGRAEPCETAMTIASPAYFETMRMPLLAGRTFMAQDDQASAPKTMVINQETARSCFPNQNPLGRVVKNDRNDVEIIGVVGDAKYHDLRETARPMFYIPTRSYIPGGLVLHVRTSIDPHALVAPIRHELREIDVGTPLTVTTLEEQSEKSLVQDRLLTTVSETFGAVALALAAIGIYGVLAFMVARRTGEIGIRMTLGARRANVLWLVLKESIWLMLIGGALGAAGALAARRLIQGLLFGVGANDQWTLIIAAAVLSIATLLASAIPASRAARIAPMAALRHE
jgi:predicted permease